MSEPMGKDRIRATLLNAWAGRLRDQEPTSVTEGWFRDWVLREAEHPQISTATATRRFVAEGKWLWSGGMNGFVLELLTTDPDLRVELRPFRTDHAYGVEMVDQNGERLTLQGFAE